ncbi:MAG: antitoxin, Phd family protein, partial [Ignavibacteria bacterium]
QVKSISYLKANAADIVRTLKEDGQPYVITQNGEAKAVIQDIESYEQTQETLALLKVLALGTKQIEEGKTQKASAAVESIRSGKR